MSECPLSGKRTGVNLKEQLFVAGLFTEYITNFSWVTFKKGTNNYTSYKKYLEDNGLL